MTGKKYYPRSAAIIAVLIVAAAVLTARSGLIRMIRRSTGAEPQLQRFTETQQKMGTFVTITVFSPDRRSAATAIESAFHRIDELERVFSTYMPESEISICNRLAADEPFPLSDEMFYLLMESVRFSEMSDGAFDITVAPLIRIWRGASRAGEIPSREDIDAALEIVGYRKLLIDEDAQSARFAREGVELDVGGIAKGYIVDQAIMTLMASGITSGMVNAGGDIYAMGRRADGREWTVGVQDPRRPDDDRSLLGVIRVIDRAVATSGNYQRYTVIDGVKYSHIIDPRIGIPADAIPSVTVMAADTLTADALATALSVLPLEQGLALAEETPDAEALLITIENDQPVKHYTSGFPRID